MSSLEIIAVVVASVWLGSLSLVSLLLVRQVAILTARLDRGDLSIAPVEDGLEVGRQIPEIVTTAVRPTELTHLLVLGAACAPCRDLAVTLDKTPTPVPGRLVAVISGRSELADGLAKLLPTWVELLRDPVATDVVNALELETTPFVFEIVDQTVMGKAAVRDADHFLRFVSTAPAGTPELEVVGNGR